MYTTSNGDTFESISRKVYGTEKEAIRIAEANPGITEPLSAGISIIIPDNTDYPQNALYSTNASNQNETAILIDGNRFRYWENIRINRSIDSIDTIDFTSPFEIGIPNFKDTFRPFSYKKISVTIGGEVFFLGTIVSIVPNLSGDRKAISVSAYGLPAVLNDCCPPSSMYPLEFANQKIKSIAKRLAKPFGIKVDVKADEGAAFETVACEPGKKILSFLSDLAKQRNLVITNDKEGDLVFWTSVKTGNPVARLEQGLSPLMSVAPTFNSQDYFSHITGISEVSVGESGAQYTAKNSRLEGVLRPFTYKLGDSESGSTKTAVNAKIGRMFGNMASYSVRVSTWRDSSGKLWEPNTTIILNAPDAMIYNDYEFVIRSVSLEKNLGSETATLNLVMPGSFSGEIPETLPWD